MRSRSTSARPLLPDTNVLVYETVEDSPRHTEAVRLLDEAERIILPSLVVHEYTWVMTRGLGVDPRFVAEKLGEYLGDPRVSYVAEPPEALRAALRLLAEHRRAARMLNDYIIMVTAKLLGARLATFDSRLARAAKSLGVDVIAP